MREIEFDFTINDVRRERLKISPDYYLMSSKGVDLSVIFEHSEKVYLVFAKEKYPDGTEKELGGAIAYSYENAVKSLLGNRYLPFYYGQTPQDTVK